MPECVHAYRYAGPAAVELPTCQRPRLLRCVHCFDSLVMRCGTARFSRCEPCSASYRRRVRRVAQSGLDGHGVGRVFFVTLTAPGADVLPWDTAACGHRADGSDCSGTIGCRVRPAAAGAWDFTAARRWSWFLTYLRRNQGMAGAQYFAVWEDQQRGVLHRHFLLRLDAPMSARRVGVFVRSGARRWGFGKQCDVKLATGDHASYCAKYATKAADTATGRRRVNPATGEISHPKRFRCWSASRGWGDSMQAVRQRQAIWASLFGWTRPAPTGTGLESNTDFSTTGVLELLLGVFPGAVLL